jgi:oligopeptide transport system substrate-binding protein
MPYVGGSLGLRTASIEGAGSVGHDRQRARLGSAFLCTLTAMIIAGCGASRASSLAPTPTARPATTQRPQGRPTLRWWNNSGTRWVRSLDPHVITDPVSMGDAALINANLVKLDYPSLRVIPDLATFSPAPDHRTWTFRLRVGARFSNGDPVTAADAAWSLTRALLPATKSPVALTYLGAITGAADVAAGRTPTLAGVTVIDPHTLRIHLDRPAAYFIRALSYPAGDVLDRRVVQGKVPGTFLTTSCSGNVSAGPFVLVCAGSGSGERSFYPTGETPELRFRPNPYYYGRHPSISIVAPFFPDAAASFRAYREGRLDGAGISPGDAPLAARLPGFVTHSALATEFITPNLHLAPFNNRHCRLAMAYAIDRERITREVLRGSEGPAYGIVPPGILGALHREPDLPSYNPRRARAELSLCPGRLQGVTLDYQNISADLRHEYARVGGNLTAIGARVTLRPLALNRWLDLVTQNMNGAGSQATGNLWPGDYPDPQDWLDNLLSATGSYNIGGYRNPRYDALVGQAAQTFNRTARRDLYRQAQRLALRDGAWIPIGYQNDLHVVSTHVRGLVATSSGIQPEGNDWSRISLVR